MIRQLKVEILWGMDESTLLTASKLKAGYRISLTDAIIVAFAIRRRAVLMQKDPELDALAGLLPMEALPCPTRHRAGSSALSDSCSPSPPPEPIDELHQ